MLPEAHKTSLLLCLTGFAAVLVLTAALYWPGLSGPFVLDDGPNIVEAMPEEKSWDSFVYMVTHNGSGASAIMSRGVSVLSFFLTSIQYHLDPWGYKYHNLLLHLLNGVLLFRFLQLLLPALDRGLDARRTLLIAGTTATLWLLHPLLVSTVLYAVQRMTQLSVCFMLLALLAYMKARSVPDDRFRFYLFGWVLMPAMALLSVMSKELAVLLPLYFLVLEVLVFKPTWDELRRDRRVALHLATFILVPLLAGLALVMIYFDALTDYSERAFTLSQRLFTQLHVLVYYLRLILAPRIRDMSLFHDDFPVTTGLDAVTVLLLGLLLAALAIAWRVRRAWPVVSFALAWFLVSHLLEATIIPLELVFEHRNYFALAAVLLLPVWAVFRFLPLKPLWPLLPLIGMVYAFMTTTRAAEWGSNDVFHQVAVQEHPRSGRALTSYINYLTEARLFEEAVRQLDLLQQLDPAEPGVPLHQQVLGCALDRRNDAALGRARQQLAENPISVYALNGLQNLTLLVVENRCTVVRDADMESLLDAALASTAVRERGRGYVLRLRGILLLSQGRYAQGYSDLRVAHELTGDVSLLTDLLRYQALYDRLGDAEETLQLIEQENAARVGVEQYQVDKARALLQEARQRVEARANAAERGDAPPAVDP